MKTPARVWYASYGSNLLAARFSYYISGGTMPGRPVAHAGTRDPTPPAADRSWVVPFRLAFGGRSDRWDCGGVAHLIPERGAGQAVVRMWQVTDQQFADIMAQENRMAPGELAIDMAALVAEGSLEVGDGAYSRVIWCGDVDGLPVLTFTVSAEREPNAPGRAYLRAVGLGLLECGLSPDKAASYLLGASGIGCNREPAWNAEEIIEALRGSA